MKHAKKKVPMKRRTKFTILAIMNIIWYTIVVLVLSFYDHTVPAELTTAWFAAWTIELALLFGIKVKSKDAPSSEYKYIYFAFVRDVASSVIPVITDVKYTEVIGTQSVFSASGNYTSELLSDFNMTMECDPLSHIAKCRLKYMMRITVFNSLTLIRKLLAI